MQLKSKWGLMISYLNDEALLFLPPSPPFSSLLLQLIFKYLRGGALVKLLPPFSIKEKRVPQPDTNILKNRVKAHAFRPGLSVCWYRIIFLHLFS